MYPTYKDLNLPEIDKEILRFWEEHDVFKQSIEQRDGAENFVFYEGPPSANGKPGIHHVMSRTIKDLFCRYQTLKGKRVERKGGWDTHGLPIELSVEKELGITKEDIGKTITVDEYNQKCRETVMRFKDEWDDITRKMGYWVDLEHPYITFENNYIESVWWLLQRLYDKGLLYKGYTIQPYSPGAGTGLSSHELNMPGAYKEVSDTTVVALFKVVKNERSAFLFNLDDEDVRIAAWTTTPWTLPSNTALTIGKNIKYVKVFTYNPYTDMPVSIIIASDLVKKWFHPNNDLINCYDSVTGWYLDPKGKSPKFAFSPQQPTILTEDVVNRSLKTNIIPDYENYINADQLEGIRYEPLLDFGNPIEPLLGTNGYGTDAYRVLIGDFVTTEDGTGVVHTAPSFGADDMRVAKSNGIGALTLVDKQGKFKDTVGEFSGRYVKNYTNDPAWENVDVDIAVHLKQSGKAFNVQKYVHNYPHCWRTDKPVLYYPLDSWFIKTSVAKERMHELNKTINWKPAATGEGRFSKWLENLQDWNLSRSRFWGIPLPIWRTDDATKELCISSKEDFRKEGWYYVLGENYEKFYRINKTDEFRGFLGKYYRYYEGKIKKGSREFLELKKSLNSNKFGLDEWRRFKVPFSLLTEILTPARAIIDTIDFHRPYIDNLLYIDEDGKTYFRETDLIDVWFDSGAMPYAQWGLDEVKLKNGVDRPFKAPFDSMYPASFIAEGVDQTRGWFYTLHAIAVMAFDSVAYKNVVSNGLVLDKDGNKMSKRLGNAADPFETISQYGADATRWYMMSNTDPWENLKFNTAGIVESRNKFFGTLFNTYNFFAMYAGIDKFVMDEHHVMPYEERPELDRWITSKLYHLVADFREAMDDYEPTKACRAIENFVDEHLSNWYVRLSRRRFWKASTDDDGKDKTAAYQTLFECLMVVSQLSSPVAPFFADWMYRNLTAPLRDKAKAAGTPLRHESVHLGDLTQPDSTKVDAALEQRMDYAQRICSLALSLRKREKLRVRQPLQKILLPILDPSFQEQVDAVADLIKAEINVKEVEYVTDTSGIITKKAKPNFKTLGKRLGKAMKAAADVIAGLSQEQINAFERSKTLAITVEGQAFDLEPEDLDVVTEDIPGWMVATDGEITVALDVTLTPELEAEGAARDLVNRIQNIRKERDYNVTDRIVVTVERHELVAPAIAQFSAYIMGETLADELNLTDELADGEAVELAGDVTVRIQVERPE